MRARLWTLSLLGVALLPPAVNAQGHAHREEATTQRHGAAPFLDAAREGTRRYHSLDSAIADGYRRIGDDLPSMGEHWVHPGLVMSGRFEASRPSILIYARGDHGPLLAGVAWTRLLEPGQGYPDFPAGPDAWHEHNGTVDDETLPLSHAMRTPTSSGTRVAILHAWVWIANPRGLWNADNWMLPFARIGLPADSTRAATARALSLAAPGAVEHYARVIARSIGGDEAERDRARVELQRAADAVTAMKRRLGSRLDEATAARFEAEWEQLWRRLAQGLDGERRARLLALHDLLRQGG